MTHADGVVTMEIIDCKPEDSGKYRCVATNIHGKDETSCVVIVEGKFGKKEIKKNDGKYGLWVTMERRSK